MRGTLSMTTIYRTGPKACTRCKRCQTSEAASADSSSYAGRSGIHTSDYESTHWNILTNFGRSVRMPKTDLAGKCWNNFTKFNLPIMSRTGRRASAQSPAGGREGQHPAVLGRPASRPRAPRPRLRPGPRRSGPGQKISTLGSFSK